MENFKDLVKFNRYKSVESFNNATDVTSSTISIVRLDKNVMDIYLGRTQLTHSNFPEVSVELRNLIDSLGSKLNDLKTDFNSKLTSVDEKYNKKLSKYITEFESGLIDLVNYTDELSKEIFDVKSDIQKKHDDTNKQIKNLTDSISVINGLISDQNKVTNELSNKVAEIKSKQTSATNNIKNLNQDVAALKLDILDLTDTISEIKMNPVTLDPIKQDIIDLSNSIDTIKGKLSEIDENKKSVNIISAKQNTQSKDIKNIKNSIDALQIEDDHIFDILSDIKKTLSNITNENNISIADLTNRLSKLETFDDGLNNDIISLKEKIEKVKNDLSKSITSNKNNISNIEIKIEDIYKKISNISNNANNEVDLEPIKNDIAILTKSIDIIKLAIDQYKTKIAKLESDQISSINKIKNISADISALKIEDAHIFDILSELKSINKIITSDIKILKEDNEKFNGEILSIKEKIEYLLDANVDSFEKIKDVNRKLNKLETADKAFQKTIDELNETIKGVINKKLRWIIL